MWGEGLKSRINKTLLFQLGILLWGAPPPSARHNKKALRTTWIPNAFSLLIFYSYIKGFECFTVPSTKSSTFSFKPRATLEYSYAACIPSVLSLLTTAESISIRSSRCLQKMVFTVLIWVRILWNIFNAYKILKALKSVWNYSKNLLIDFLKKIWYNVYVR